MVSLVQFHSDWLAPKPMFSFQTSNIAVEINVEMLSKRHTYVCVCVCVCIYMYPWLRVRWFSFSKKCLNKTVAGKVTGSFYWHGRDAESESELNPKVPNPNLPSTHI
jgi:hypothetical protein